MGGNVFGFSILHILKSSLCRIDSNRITISPYCSLNMRVCYGRQPAIVASLLWSWKNLNENLKFTIFWNSLSHRESTCPSKYGDPEMQGGTLYVSYNLMINPPTGDGGSEQISVIKLHCHKTTKSNLLTGGNESTDWMSLL